MGNLFTKRKPRESPSDQPQAESNNSTTNVKHTAASTEENHRTLKVEADKDVMLPFEENTSYDICAKGNVLIMPKCDNGKDNAEVVDAFTRMKIALMEAETKQKRELAALSARPQCQVEEDGD